MNKQPLAKGLAISMVPLLALLFSSSIVLAGPENAEGKRDKEVGSMGPVPKAQCGRSDNRKRIAGPDYVV